MAQNYCLFSTFVKAKPETIAWVKEYFGSIAHSEDLLKAGFDKHEIEGMDSNEVSGIRLDFRYDSSGVLVYSEECGTVDVAGMLISMILERDGSEDYILFEWAYTCSKARPGQFGGGFSLIFADEVAYPSRENWIAEKLQARSQGKPKS